MLARFLTAFLLICSVGQIVASDRGQQGVSPDDGTDGGSSSAGAPDIGIGKLGGGPCVLTATTTDTRVHKIAFAISYVDTVGVIANLISEKGGEFDAGTVYPHAFEYLKFRVAEFKFPKTQPAQLDLSFYYSPLDGSLAYHLSPSTVYNKGLTSWSLECNREPIPKLF
ncbi:uncharacterized protein L969DRAFT_54059 [Mixia osmundae IAM 14324]|uniref:Uncharacterized protein n=1 Tax=Mixia osmundae (strain CBS 9802 / IAM 14324 / JCM 22182 / KY 12970) TaxID=764103 RepID=G7E2B8_MIXOS|nr:uncharacterized protein L969DRAFT_54059 [Mixia osmundae IAM 14324]KEI36850.1 hypothetical protein L969DRAFT_54059 [Mixia osmundae IAM 14324]GAA96978.1 hypothetical protein E5Q_03652 [Mixia osmundae IAM 14324]